MELTIGEVARRAGVATSAIRFYEREGLLPVAARVSGQRRYGEDTIRRLEIIGVAKGAGFALPEIRVLLDSVDAGSPASAPLRDLVARRLPDVEALIVNAERMRAWLEHAAGCRCDSLDGCALFTAGSGDGLPMAPSC